MDSFHEPRRVSEPVKLEDITAEVLAREAEYRAKNIPLSGRILHVCHYLPIAATLQASSRPGIISPPATPPHPAADIPPVLSESASGTAHTLGSDQQPKWSLTTRQGHAAMISGIRSLSSTHEQLIIGWIGDIESPNSTSGMSRNSSPSWSY
jgi:trehalose 6-phosphate synthase/phosphatase